MAQLEGFDKEGSAGGNASIVKAVKDLIEELQVFFVFVIPLKPRVE